ADALASARTKLARLVVQGPARFGKGEYTAAVERARGEKDRAERALATRSSSFEAELARSGAGSEDVLRSRAPAAALESFVRHGADPSYVAFVQRAGATAPAVIALGPAKRIEQRVASLRSQIELQAGSAGRAEALSERRYREAGAILRREIWDPLLPALGPA